MEIAVHPGKPVNEPAKAPAPGDRILLQLLARLGRQQGVGMGIAVEDPHEALAVGHQLANAAMVERGLLPLLGMDRRQEARQGLGPLHVAGLDGAGEQPLEVEPIQGSLALLHELEELDGIRGRYQWPRLAHEADVETPHVPGKAVVGRVAIERLPGAIGRVVVAESLGGPRAGNDERAAHAPHHALDLERHSVPEPLGVVHRDAGREGAHRQDLRWRSERAGQIVRESRGADHPRWSPAPSRIRHLATAPACAIARSPGPFHHASA
jgi:hypothetical protein